MTFSQLYSKGVQGQALLPDTPVWIFSDADPPHQMNVTIFLFHDFHFEPLFVNTIQMSFNYTTALQTAGIQKESSTKGNELQHSTLNITIFFLLLGPAEKEKYIEMQSDKFLTPQHCAALMTPELIQPCSATN